MTWLHTLYTKSNEAETGILRQLENCKRNLDNAQKGVLEGEAGAKNRLPFAQQALREAEKLKETWYIVNAMLELVVTKAISDEKRNGLPPTILEWIEDVNTTIKSQS